MRLSPTGMDVLSFVPATRAGDRSKTERSYLDFDVNERRLSGFVDAGDRITPFGWLARADERRFARQLILREPSEFRSGHVPLYICAQCADLGCSGITVLIRVQDDCIVWSEIGFEDFHAAREPGQPVEKPPLHEPLRELWFDREQYKLAIAPLL